MKRISAILILGVLLFNWVGYQVFTAVAENAGDQSLITRLDKDQFLDSELVSIKVPAVHLSPYTNEKNFERVNGQIEIGSRVYNYVKRRITQDSLEFLCIPNDQATLLRIAKYDFFKLVADLQAEQSKKTSSNNTGHKTLNGEYFFDNSGDLFATDPPVNIPATGYFIAGPTAGFADFDGPPPQLSC